MKNSVVFDRGCAYDLKNAEQQESTNKLFGFSFGFHKKNSVRFGWRYDVEKKKILILPFIHYKWKMIIGPILFEINVNDLIDLSIEKLNDKIVFIAEYEGIKHYFNFTVNNINSFFGYRLFPYFGGRSVAPHTMKIFLKTLK